IRQEQRLDWHQTGVRQELLDTEVRVSGRNDVVRRVAATGRIAECRIKHEAAAPSDKLNLISATQYGCTLLTAQPRNVPGKPHSRSKIIQIPIVDSLARVARLRPHVNDFHQVAAHTR